MKLNKIFLFGSLAFMMGATSCVGDLDLDPIDPNYADEGSSDFLANSFAECYSIMAVSGQDGPGSSIISGLDNGTGNYSRALFMMNEFTTDEAMWIWKDAGVYDLITCTFDASNGNIEGTYARLYAHIAVCNQFINSVAEDDTNEDHLIMRDEARALRAMSYYWVLDIWGNATFTLDSPDGVTAPQQTTRQKLYDWLEGELVYLADESHLMAQPYYGRVGKDGAEALLARLYLNAGVYTGTAQWDKCLERCNNVIDRHKGGGFYGSGLANDYLSLFCADNDQYMPGGSNSAENEILWGIAFDSEHTQSYGGTTFIIASQVNGTYETGRSLGLNAEWGCLKAIEQLTYRFTQDDLENPTTDPRCNKWLYGEQTFGDNTVDITIENAKFGDWLSGATVIKWSNLKCVDGQVDWNRTQDYSYPDFADADFAFIRLADIYLMTAECFLNGATGITSNEAVNNVNYVRQRAGQSQISNSQLNEDFLLNERSRELYWELTRRSDLVRYGKFAGNGQDIWAWKGDIYEGATIDERYNLMPIPTNIMAAQPYFEQNKGW